MATENHINAGVNRTIKHQLQIFHCRVWWPEGPSHFRVSSVWDQELKDHETGRCHPSLGMVDEGWSMGGVAAFFDFSFGGAEHAFCWWLPPKIISDMLGWTIPYLEILFISQPPLTGNCPWQCFITKDKEPGSIMNRSLWLYNHWQCSELRMLGW